MRDMRRRYEEMEHTLSPQGWKEELEVAYRQRRSVIFVIAIMIMMAAFWTSTWIWVIFFAVLGLYSLAAGVRIGMVCGLSFSIWFLCTIEHWIKPLTWQNQVAGLWCIATLFLVIVWKADGVAQLKLLHKGEDSESGILED